MPTTAPAATPALLLLEWAVEGWPVVGVEDAVAAAAAAAVTGMVRMMVEPPTVTVTGTTVEAGSVVAAAIAVVVGVDAMVVELVELVEDVEGEGEGEGEDEEDACEEGEDELPDDRLEDPGTVPTLDVMPESRTVHALVPPPVLMSV